MKLRYALLSLASVALIAAGCGSDDDGNKKKDSDKKPSKAEAAAEKDRDVKLKAVDKAKKDFEKDSKDVGACRNLAMAYVSLASPASSPDPKKPTPLPKDRDENLGKSVKTLEDCVDLDKGDRDVKQMLASVYMATNKYGDATPLLADLARTAKGAERSNAFYAWGLAASNAQEYPAAINAWQQFVRLADAKDPRVPQVKQSIKALQQAAKAPKAPAADAAAGDDAADESGDDAADDNGGDDN